MGSGFGTLLLPERRAKVLRLNAPTHQSARLQSHGVGHREIARREDSRNLDDLRPQRLSLGPPAKGNRAGHFAQFSEMSDERETGWWSELNSNSRFRFL